MKQIGAYKLRKHESRRYLTLTLASKLKCLGIKKLSEENNLNYETTIKILNRDSRVNVDAPWIEKLGEVVGVPREKRFE